MGSIEPGEWVRNIGGRYASALGIDLAGPDAAERFKWFLAAMLYGARISESIATRSWCEFAARDVLTPGRLLETGWDGLVRDGLRLRRQAVRQPVSRPRAGCGDGRC